jgi:hypothetical protein
MATLLARVNCGAEPGSVNDVNPDSTLLARVIAKGCSSI